MQTVADMLSVAPLDNFNIYSTVSMSEALSTDKFFRDIAIAHRPLLRRFSVHRIVIGLPTLQEICFQCYQLEQLFVVLRVQPGLLVKPLFA
jgi:hypothetical protein